MFFISNRKTALHYKRNNWKQLVSRTGLAGGSMAARSPSILSLEHSENTCSWRDAWGSLSSVSLTTSDNGELKVPGPVSDARDGKKIQWNADSQPSRTKNQSCSRPGSQTTYIGPPQERGGPHWTQKVSGWGWGSPGCPGSPASFSPRLQCLEGMKPLMMPFSPRLMVYSMDKWTKIMNKNTTTKKIQHLCTFLFCTSARNFTKIFLKS